MQKACIHCGAEYLLKDAEFGGHSKVRIIVGRKLIEAKQGGGAKTP